MAQHDPEGPVAPREGSREETATQARCSTYSTCELVKVCTCSYLCIYMLVCVCTWCVSQHDLYGGAGAVCLGSHRSLVHHTSST